MGNNLPFEKKSVVVSALCEGASICGIGRMTGMHERSAVVVERFGGKTVWVGVVESFALTGDPKAKRCYAWSYQDKGEIQYVSVPEIPPVVSPETAVKVAIVNDVKLGEIT